MELRSYDISLVSPHPPWNYQCNGCSLQAECGVAMS